MTVSDIEHAKTIFRTSLPILKGKKTRRYPDMVISDYVDVPPNILQSKNNVTLFGEIFFVNKIPFFAMVYDHLKFTTAEHIHTRKMKKTLLSSTSNQSNLPAVSTSPQCLCMEDFYPSSTPLPPLDLLSTTRPSSNMSHRLSIRYMWLRIKLRLIDIPYHLR